MLAQTKYWTQNYPIVTAPSFGYTTVFICVLYYRLESIAVGKIVFKTLLFEDNEEKFFECIYHFSDYYVLYFQIRTFFDSSLILV